MVGRYYAMDRDKRWERVEVGLNAICIGDGEESTDPVKTIKERYDKGENDEFLKPIIVGGKEARIKGQSKPHSYFYLQLTNLQTEIRSSSSTTARIVSERLPSSLVMSIALQEKIFHIQRTSPLPQ